MHYKVLIATNEQLYTAKNELEKDIDFNLQQNWVPQGGISISYNSNCRLYILSQAIVRK